MLIRQKNHPLMVIGCLVFLSRSCLCQVDSLHSYIDSALVDRTDVLDSGSLASPVREVKNFHSTKSPWLAVGLSAMTPGAGQLYNRNYWKAPVIWGLAGYWIYEWVKLNNKYEDFRDQYNQSLMTSPPEGNGRLLGNRDFYRDERDKFAWYLGALYFLNLVDAYVGAHLYDFDVSPDLAAGGRVEPKFTATLRLHF